MSFGVRSQGYGPEMLQAGRRRKPVPTVTAEPGLVVEDPVSGFCGAVERVERDAVVLADANGRCRTFPLRVGGFLLDGKPVTLVRPEAPAGSSGRSASGSVRVAGLTARTAAQSRIWVEGLHDAELVERIWGHDLRVLGVVTEPLHGVDELTERIAEFGPGPDRRLGILVDHLVTGSKEARLAEAARSEHVLVTGHPYVDIWQAVRPAVLGIDRWPEVPRGVPWKEGVCRALGWTGAGGEVDTAAGWRRVLGAVATFRDIEPALLGAVEQLIDFVTEPQE